jgi:hypothetical protein
LKKNEDQGTLRLKNFLKRINMPEPGIRCCLWDSALLQKKIRRGGKEDEKAGVFFGFCLGDGSAFWSRSG